MNSIDLVKMGLNNLRRRKARTFLTVLGVIIGTASIVTMMSLGFGMKYSFEQQLSSMGSMTTIEVHQSYNDMRVGRGGMVVSSRSGSQKDGTLDDSAILKISRLPGVEAVSPEIESYVRIVSGKYVADLPVRGINPEVMEAFGLEPEEGRLLRKGDEAVLVFGAQTVHNFVDPKLRDPWRYMTRPGEKPKVNVLKDKLSLTFDYSYGYRKSPYEQNSTEKKPKLYKIGAVGVLRQGQMDSDYAAYMDIAQLKKIIQDNAKYMGQNDSASRQSLEQQLKYQRARVKVADMKDVAGVQEMINEMGLQTYSLNDVLKSMEETSRTIQMVLGGIGAISLLVAALGITNTMIMSIYERTREIGIMKVIGASLKDIKRLFLFEAGMIGMLGGLLGMGVSLLLSLILNSVSNNGMFFMGMGGESKISVIPLWLALAAIALSIAVGLVSGYYPAKRAMKLSALEAIKNE